MATKSILKTVYIRDNESARKLAGALENASQKSARPVVFKRSVSQASQKEIRDMFGQGQAR